MKYSAEQLRAIHAKRLYEKNHDIVEALKAKHGNKKLITAHVFHDPKYRKHLDENGDLIMKYSIDDDNHDFKILTPIEMFTKNSDDDFDRNYVPSDGNWIQKYLYKGAGKIVEMPPDEFLKLASPIGKDRFDEKSYMKSSLKQLREGMGIREGQIPQLNIEPENGVLRVVGHEGRHRAFVANEKGVKLIPVMMASSHSDTPLTESDKINIEKRKLIPESLKEMQELNRVRL